MKNQPAFPLNVSSVNAIEYSGMTLRDYFAAKAMQGAINARIDPDGKVWWDAEDIARDAYITADAMLKERSK